MDFNQRLWEDRQMVELRLKAYSAPESPYLIQKDVFEAMRYSLLGGGKRLRAILALEFCRAFGGELEEALPAACALEMIHAYSLIHDDLPCMDDDDLRRGKPTNHKKFGDALALLAGDGLLTLAFEILSREDSVELMGPARCIETIHVLSCAAGEYGMLGGQVADVLGSGRAMTKSEHSEMVAMKTGALLRAAVHCGCIAGKAGKEQTQAALHYAERIGTAFQITDDLLDVLGDPQLMGKNVGSDQRADKNTFVTMLGFHEAQRRAFSLFEKASEEISSLFGEEHFLMQLTDWMARRSQ